MDLKVGEANIRQAGKDKETGELSYKKMEGDETSAQDLRQTKSSISISFRVEW